MPHEQLPNTFVTPDLSFQFHYFALRKMHFLLRARAVAVFPGGFGTFDEMFELLTLIQTGKVRPLPILLFGREFWERVVDFQGLAEEGVISPGDLDLITWCENAEEAWDYVAEYYARLKQPPGLRLTAAWAPRRWPRAGRWCCRSAGAAALPSAAAGTAFAPERPALPRPGLRAGGRLAALLVEIGHDVGAVLRIAEAGECHLGARREFARAGEPGVHRLPVPIAALAGFSASE